MTFQETFAKIAQSDLPLQGKLDAFKVEFDTRLAPPAAVKALHRSVDELIASGAESRALKAGDVAPEFILPDPDGKPVSSNVLLAQGPLVVTFYRSARCEPDCDLSADGAQQPEIAEAERTGVPNPQRPWRENRCSVRRALDVAGLSA